MPNKSNQESNPLDHAEERLKSILARRQSPKFKEKVRRMLKALAATKPSKSAPKGLISKHAL